MNNRTEDEALEQELDRAAMVAAKVALESVTAFLKGHARIVIEHKSTADWITFEPTAKGMNQS
jgi:hypothetical protein